MYSIHTAAALFVLILCSQAQADSTATTMEAQKPFLRSFFKGGDARIPVPDHDLKKLPYSSILPIFQNGHFLCNGSKVAPSLILTAAHCAKNPGLGSSSAKVNVTLTAESHSGEHYKIAYIHELGKYDPNEDPYYSTPQDLILLETARPMGSETGQLGVANNLKADGMKVLLPAFHGDAPAVLKKEQCVVKDVYTSTFYIDRIEHNCGLASGSSGAPLITEYEGSFYIIGVVTSVGKKHYAHVIGGRKTVDSALFGLLKAAQVPVREPSQSEGVVPHFGGSQTY